MLDHDVLFKTILTTFFFEFLESFVPNLAPHVDPASIEFIDKETFPARGRKKVSDLVVKVKFHGRDMFFVILVEHQSKPQSDFPKRLFQYFARLSEKYGHDVYPVVIYSHDAPKKQEPSTYEVTFPGKKVLKFDFDVIQLNRMSWREFIQQPNPAATALMSKMSIDPKDRPRVKAECLRLLTTLRLDAGKAEFIYAFVENYLNLNAEEDRIYEEVLEEFGVDVKETAMEIMSSHRREGIHEGLERAATIILRKRFSTLPPETTARLDSLSTPQLDDLFLKINDFQSLSDLDAWLTDKLGNYS